MPKPAGINNNMAFKLFYIIFCTFFLFVLPSEECIQAYTIIYVSAVHSTIELLLLLLTSSDGIGETSKDGFRCHGEIGFSFLANVEKLSMKYVKTLAKEVKMPYST